MRKAIYRISILALAIGLSLAFAVLPQQSISAQNKCGDDTFRIRNSSGAQLSPIGGIPRNEEITLEITCATTVASVQFYLTFIEAESDGSTPPRTELKEVNSSENVGGNKRFFVTHTFTEPVNTTVKILPIVEGFTENSEYTATIRVDSRTDNPSAACCVTTADCSQFGSNITCNTTLPGSDPCSTGRQCDVGFTSEGSSCSSPGSFCTQGDCIGAFTSRFCRTNCLNSTDLAGLSSCIWTDESVQLTTGTLSELCDPTNIVGIGTEDDPTIAACPSVCKQEINSGTLPVTVREGDQLNRVFACYEQRGSVTVPLCSNAQLENAAACSLGNPFTQEGRVMVQVVEVCKPDQLLPGKFSLESWHQNGLSTEKHSMDIDNTEYRGRYDITGITSAAIESSRDFDLYVYAGGGVNRELCKVSVDIDSLEGISPGGGQTVTPTNGVCNCPGAASTCTNSDVSTQVVDAARADAERDLAGRFASCKTCIGDGNTWTDSLGCVETTAGGLFTRVLQIALGVVGGITLIRLIILGYQYNFSDKKGDIKTAAKDVIATLGGLLLILFSVVLLRIIGVNILDIVPPGFFGT